MQEDPTKGRLDVPLLPDVTFLPAKDISNAISEMYKRNQKKMPSLDEVAFHFLLRRIDILESLYQEYKDPEHTNDARRALLQIWDGMNSLSRYAEMRDAFELLEKTPSETLIDRLASGLKIESRSLREYIVRLGARVEKSFGAD